VVNIVFLDRSTIGSDIDISALKKYGTLTVYETTTSDQTKERIAGVDVIITNKVVIDREMIETSSSLELICIAATGMNNVDLDAAEENGVVVRNAVGYSTNSVVQHTFSMLFHLIGHMRYYDDYVKAKGWQNSPIFTHVDKPFYEVAGKRWGIIGMGAIGQKVAAVASTFGAEVVYYSTSGKNSDQPFEQVDLKTLLQTSDIITIHAPLNDQTNNLLYYPNLMQLKSNAVLINVGRGGIVNEHDLYNVMMKKDIFVGLDVLASEPMEKDHKLLEVPNLDRLYISPHTAWTSVEARKKLVEIIGENIATFLKESE
jgi:glycerate dehydrogenase